MLHSFVEIMEQKQVLEQYGVFSRLRLGALCFPEINPRAIPSKDPNSSVLYSRI